MAEISGKHWTENFRILTPMLITVGIFMLGQLISTTNKIDDKLFRHLTNEEIHTVRSQVVSKAEFDLICKVRDQQYNRICEELSEIRRLLKK